MIKESHFSAADAALSVKVRAGDYWFQPIAAGDTLRIVDCEGNQAADTLFYSAADPAERYSAVDTIREQGNIYLSAGSRLMSTRGNVLLEIKIGRAHV